MSTKRRSQWNERLQQFEFLDELYQGPPGENGQDGLDGAPGPPGPAGADGTQTSAAAPIEVTSAPVTVFGWEGLDLEAHGTYILKALIKGVGSSFKAFELQFNSDTDPASYRRESFNRYGRGQASDGFIGFINTTGTAYFEVKIVKDPDGSTLWYADMSAGRSTDWDVAHTAGIYIPTDNITEIDVLSVVAGGIDVGSKGFLQKRLDS